MEVGYILVRAAVDDQPVARLLQIELDNQALHSLEQVGHKIGVGGREIGQAGKRPFRREENMEGITGVRMIKSQEGVGFV